MKVSRTLWTTLQAGVPAIIVGENGIGKSSSLVEFARILNRDYVHLPLIGAAPEDLLGYPIVKDGYCAYAPHYWLDKLAQGAILILEEVNRLDNDRMQNVLAQLLDKQLGQYRLPQDTIIAGTANIWDIALNEVNLNLLTRCAWYPADVSNAEEEKALITGEYDLNVSVKILPENWRNSIPTIRIKMAGFFRSRPNSFKRPEGVPTTPWPCPRTVQKHAIPALAASYAVGYRTYDDYMDILRACCGPVFAEDFAIWLEAKSRPPQEIYEDIKKGKKIPIAELTIGISEIYAWVQEYMLDRRMDEAKEIWQNCINYLAEHLIGGDAAELAVYLASIFMTKPLGRVPPAFVKLIKRVGNV